jgi:hypothetical protein
MADSPSGQPSTTTVPPAAAQPPASSSTVQDTFKQQAESARTPADVRKAIEQMKGLPKTPAKPVTQTPPEVAPVEEAPAEVAPEATPETSEETPTTEPGDEPVTPPADQPMDTETDEGDDGGEGPITPVAGKRAHLRLAETDQVGRLAASYMKRNRDMPMEEAVAKARAQLGISTDTTQAAATPKEGPKSSLPKTTQEVDSLMEAKFSEYEKAMTEVRFEDAAKINREIHQLNMHRSTIERSAEREQAQAAQRYESDFSASEKRATDLYPAASDEASPFAKRMAQIDADLKRNGDPLYARADKPLVIAQMVAAELKIAPRNKNATPAAKAPAAVPQQNSAPKKGVVPSGSSRTVPPATNQPAVDPEITGIRTQADLRKQFKRLGIPGY